MPDAGHEGRERGDDGAGPFHRHRSRTLGVKHEPDGIRPEARRQDAVLRPRDPADLHTHRRTAAPIRPHVLVLTTTPLARAPPMMGHGDDLYRILMHSIDDTERKVRQHEPTRSIIVALPTFRCIADFPHSPSDLRRERSCCNFASFRIPSPSFQKFCLGSGMKAHDQDSSLAARNSFAFTSSQGTKETEPESSSSILRAISRVHASSTSGSGSRSMLSKLRCLVEKVHN